jgi:predicted amidohydrolase YtcJ
MKIYNGNIISCDAQNSIYEYLVEDKGKIVFLGDQLPEEYSGLRINELGKKALLPSFADTHLHFASYAFFASNLDVREAGSFDEIRQLLKEYISATQPKYVLAFGASAHNVKEKKLITRKELDKVHPEMPAMLVKYDGHACIINSAMLKMLPKETSKLRGFNAETGFLGQEAFFASTDFITKKVSPIKLVGNMLKGIDKMAAQGFGMMHTAEGVGFPRDMDVDIARLLAKSMRNQFQSRIFFQTMTIPKVQKRKLPRIGGCFETALDGCFGSVDAAMLKPYSNNSTNKGVLYYSQNQVNAFVKEANRAGLQIAMHAIGDAAFDQVVNAFDFALKDFPRKDHRHIIIHAPLTTPRSLEKAAELNLGIASQPAFIRWAQEPLEYLEEIMGDRAYKLFNQRDMLDLGLKVSGGSDAPCTIPDIGEGLYGACNHYVSEQSVSIEEALRFFTWNAAWTSFDEKERGSLEKGKIADMCILNENPLTLHKSKLRDLKSEKLILSGNDYLPGQSIGNLLLRRVIGL